NRHGHRARATDDQHGDHDANGAIGHVKIPEGACNKGHRKLDDCKPYGDPVGFGRKHGAMLLDDVVQSAAAHGLTATEFEISCSQQKGNKHGDRVEIHLTV